MGNSVGEHYDKLGARYDESTKVIDNLVAPMRPLLLAHAKGEVLEVAVASGRNFEHYPKDCRVVGVDLSRVQLERAVERAERHSISFEPKIADVEHLPFSNGRFDTVVCTLGGCVFPDTVAAYRELRRVCSPKGHVLFLEHVWPEQLPLQAFLWLVSPIAKKQLDCDPTRDIEKAITEAGLHVAQRLPTKAFGIVRSLVTVPDRAI